MKARASKKAILATARVKAMLSENRSNYTGLKKEFMLFLKQCKGSGKSIEELMDIADEAGYEWLDGEHLEFLAESAGYDTDSVEGEDFEVEDLIKHLPAYFAECREADFRFNGRDSYDRDDDIFDDSLFAN